MLQSEALLISHIKRLDIDGKYIDTEPAGTLEKVVIRHTLPLAQALKRQDVTNFRAAAWHCRY